MYNLIIYLYLTGVAIYSLFDEKVRKMWRGERAAFSILKEKVDPNARYAWFHAASLGEFEQGRPIMEKFRAQYPDMKILLTFFSPSGYEVRKNYEGADIICYLPLDTPINAHRFLSLINPEIVFFIKYEFWYNYLHILKKRNIPTYSVSSIFREEQIFFQWYGKAYSRVLKCFTRFFVQNKVSKELLNSKGFINVDITGDTRFDRVLQIKSQARQLPIIEAFRGNSKVFIAGSSWLPDEEIFIEYFNKHPEWKLIIAPHVIGENHLQEIESMLRMKTVRYTDTNEQEAATAQCIIINCFGLLSSIYNYADISYVGGGFGVGIHNVLEAGVWGIPVIFGPNNKRFDEAQGLLACGGGFEITSGDEFRTIADKLITDEMFLTQSGKAAGEFVMNNSGATDRVLGLVKNFANLSTIICD